jgi:hypothetical protein
MRKFLLSTLAAATIVSAGLVASRAAATTLVQPTETTVSQPQLRVAAVVCGSNGCGVVQVKGGKQKKMVWLGHG